VGSDQAARGQTNRGTSIEDGGAGLISVFGQGEVDNLQLAAAIQSNERIWNQRQTGARPTGGFQFVALGRSRIGRKRSGISAPAQLDVAVEEQDARYDVTRSAIAAAGFGSEDESNSED
jgi:hypothetical protein